MTREEAIARIKDHMSVHKIYEERAVKITEALNMAIDALKAQEACGDAVSRQTLQEELALYPIDDITSEDEAGYNRAINDVQKMVLQLPSAQPEIIMCKDCVHHDTFPEDAHNDMPLKCLGIRYGGVMPDWYCEHAERRTDDEE